MVEIARKWVFLQPRYVFLQNIGIFHNLYVNSACILLLGFWELIMIDNYSYVRPRSVKGEKPEYTFYKMTDAVRVVRKINGDEFEYTFKKGDLIQGRTLKEFDFMGGYENQRSVYVTSNEYSSSNAQSLANQVDFIYNNRNESATVIEQDVADILLDQKSSPTDKECLINARIGQGTFRRDLFIMWGGCAVTGCTTKELLIASHIKPWNKSNGKERLDVFNGLLLIANLDKAFDSGLISFSSVGEIMILTMLSECHEAGVDSAMKIRLKQEHEPYLKYHREHVFKEK